MFSGGSSPACSCRYRLTQVPSVPSFTLYLSGDLGDRAGLHDHHLDRLVPKFRT
jgi:hypothetical protein